MGIHGLTGFIDNNQHLLHQHRLHDCSVVLDGNNFYHFLYYACHVQCSFGGDYDVYRKRIISTFESFKKCRIIPYVILDGAYTVDGRKLKTSLARALSRIKLIDTMANNQKGHALPALAYETFLQTIDEQGIPHATCQFEADNEIAVLANKLHCPVISNDSDFYIFDLEDGFLPLDYLDFRPLERHNSDGTLYYYLHCHKYCVDDFINSFDGLNRTVLPVFASLLGNDFINASAFSTFYSRVKVPKVVSKKFSLPPRLSKVISVLHWLNTQNESAEFFDLKDELLEFIKPRSKVQVERMFVSSVNGYTDVDNFQGFDLFHFLTTGPEQFQFTATVDFRSFNGAEFPNWLLKAICCGKITPSTVNSAILHRVIILTQVEDLFQESSFQCSVDLRRVLYGVLLQEDLHAAINSKSSSQSFLQDNSHEESSQSFIRDSTYKGSAQSLSTDSNHEGFSQSFLQDPIHEKAILNLPKDPNHEESVCGEKQEKEKGGVDETQKRKEEVDEIKEREKGVNEIQEREKEVDEKQVSQKEEVEEELDREKSRDEELEVDENKVSLNVVKELIAGLKNIRDSCAGGGGGITEVINAADTDPEVCDDEVLVERSKAEDERKKCKQFCVEEYTRIRKNLLKTLVEPLYHVGNVPVPSLADLPAMAVADRKSVLAAALGVDLDFMGKFSEDLQLFAACLVMWSRNAKPRITRGHLETVIVGLMFLQVFVSPANRTERNDGENIHEMRKNRSCDVKRKSENHKQICGELSKRKCEQNVTRKQNSVNKDSSNLLEVKCGLGTTEPADKIEKEENFISIEEFENFDNETQPANKNVLDCSAGGIDLDRLSAQVQGHHQDDIRQNLHKYHAKCPVFNNNNQYLPRIPHAFAQLQACMVDSINLNKLLLFPFSNIRPADFINGTFLYNFYADISLRAKPELFLAVMFERNSDVISTFELFRDVIVNYVGEDCFNSPTSSSKKTRKRKPKGDNKRHNVMDETGDRKANKEMVASRVAGFDVANKFSVLSMDDC